MNSEIERLKKAYDEAVSRLVVMSPWATNADMESQREVVKSLARYYGEAVKAEKEKIEN